MSAEPELVQQPAVPVPAVPVTPVQPAEQPRAVVPDPAPEQSAVRTSAPRRGARWGSAVLVPAVLVPVGLAVAWLLLLVATGWGAQSWERGYDLAVYRDGVRDLLSGRDVYLRVTDRGHYFVYPPFAAVLFSPVLLLPAALALWVWDAVLVVVTVLAGARLLRLVGAGPLATGLGLAAVLVSDPFREAFVLGQVSPLVVLGLVAGCTLAGGRGAVLAALAAAVKVTPALVLVAVANPAARRRFVVPTVAVGASVTLLGALTAPASWRSYFTELLWDSARVAEPGTPSNNSLAGAFAHAGLGTWGSSLVGALLAVPLVLVTLLVARRVRWERAAERLGLGLVVSLVTCLVSPVTWNHHALAAPLAGVLLLVRLAPTRRARGLAAAALVPWLLPVLQWADRLHAGRGAADVAGTLLAETRPLSLLLLVVLLAVPLLRAHRPSRLDTPQARAEGEPRTGAHGGVPAHQPRRTQP
ncbi:glycosyltransferase family 87 protein [Kineococcus rubinsiae]|uniref:glycosyltransferase family 87 protein n=1 Tax=Kineococcus rubinsiae TaxID=2609562 RepID=UPI00142F3D1F|nr:glycosyltransferase family 87 protein [Kineococcus rubinsiae]